MAATKKEAAKMAAGKSNTAAGRAVAGSHLWMQRLVEAGRFPTLARMFAAQLGEEVEWIPLPQNDFKEYKLNQDEAMAKLFPHADKASLFDFWPSNQPQWDGIAIGKDSGALYLVEAKAHRKEAEGQKLGATAQERGALRAASLPRCASRPAEHRRRSDDGGTSSRISWL